MTGSASFEKAGNPTLSDLKSPKTIPLIKTLSLLLPASKPSWSHFESSAKRRLGRLLDAPENLLWQVTCLLSIISACLFPAATIGQEISQQTKASATQTTSSNSDQAKYDQLIEEIYSSVEDSYEASMQFYVNGLEESYHWKDKWRAKKDQTNRLLADFRATACRIYGSDSPQPESLGSIIEAIAKDMYASNQLQDLHLVYEKRVATDPEDVEQKKQLAMVYVKTNRFREAHDLLNSIDPAQLGTFEDADRNLLLFLPQLVGTYEQEMQIRDKEKQADDLPRVELVTPSGTMVVELFENEAPETVANFISLVESGHYDNAIFHRVIPNFVAQCGGFTENNSPKTIGYTINDEFKNPNFRRHFSGSLSMANTGKPNSGQAQFFINLAPTPFLDGKHTVFGTVIEGAAAYQRITPTHKIGEDNKEEPIDSAVADKIISAKVLRKRDHAYQPTKARQLPR